MTDTLRCPECGVEVATEHIVWPDGPIQAVQDTVSGHSLLRLPNGELRVGHPVPRDKRAN